MLSKQLTTCLAVGVGILGLGFARSNVAVAQEKVTLVERFDAANPYRVELKVRLSGRLAVAFEKGKPPEVLPFSGSSTLVYDEKVLPADEPRTAKAIRVYRETEFARTIDGKEQKADIRPAVRRMVVLRSERGKKVPFSPDGPLTWSEIDLIRTDLFSLALVTGLLPAKPVSPGDKWNASPNAVGDLTDFDPIEEGGLVVEFLSVVTLNNKKYAKLQISGTVKGVTDDGPSRQQLSGTAYFDLEANRLTYLNLKGVHELLGPDGKTTGRVDGTFVMTRGPASRGDGLTPTDLQGIALSPTPENSLLLYDNPDFGVKFLHPRRWRVGTVQGKQLTIEESGGGGILLTAESNSTLPTPEQYLTESRAYLAKQKWTVNGSDQPRRISDTPDRVDRFAIDAEVDKQHVQMEYAVVAQAVGGATIAARLPWAEREELRKDVDRIIKSLQIIKRIEK
ncbi:hypothetical protein [Fimbriiglobus ruber]|uniref:Uncharacterized protein n=1 Tax=Fimbriiglobus ruber TaxID=1908690 RepID=A0A225DDI2_9BACT|nr:hypothetical protein [Fimbriiglobus ruber]OWK34465.1 hypothetical protein FRUB_10436 [Fimbriiglobus ruber]